jgi:hypothetical protein
VLTVEGKNSEAFAMLKKSNWFSTIGKYKHLSVIK